VVITINSLAIIKVVATRKEATTVASIITGTKVATAAAVATVAKVATTSKRGAATKREIPATVVMVPATTSHTKVAIRSVPIATTRATTTVEEAAPDTAAAAVATISSATMKNRPAGVGSLKNPALVMVDKNSTLNSGKRAVSKVSQHRPTIVVTREITLRKSRSSPSKVSLRLQQTALKLIRSPTL
jgi:hypothetical protein